MGAVARGGRAERAASSSAARPPGTARRRGCYRLWWKQLAVYGSTMGTPSDFEGAYELVRTGPARVHIDSVFPLADAVHAHQRLESGAQFGKVVLSIP